MPTNTASAEGPETEMATLTNESTDRLHAELARNERLARQAFWLMATVIGVVVVVAAVAL